MILTPQPHHWRFFRAGGFDQVRLETGADILALESLDQKLWVALACPVAGIEFDGKTLELLDTDGDGRIRAREIIDAVRWLRKVLKDPEELVREGEALSLAAIDETSREGARVLASAKRVLANLGTPDAAEISVAETQDTQRIFAQTWFNGDGIIPAEAAEDEAVRSVITDILTCLGGETDRSGLPGVSQSKVDAFFAAIASHAAWLEAAAGSAHILALGEATAAAGAAMDAVADKIDGFFLRCALAGFSPEAADNVNPSGETFAELADKNLSDSLALLAPLPLAAISSAADLPLKAGLNPAWADKIAAFHAQVVVPLLGARDVLGAREWADIKARFAAYAAWQSIQPHTPVAVLAAPRILAIAQSDAKPAIDALIAKDIALEAEAAAIGEVAKLVLLRRDLFRLVNNFVSFREFYTRDRKAIFLAGTLYLDGRSADLCIRVEDVAKHAVLATLSRIFLVYCDCRRRGSNEQMTVAAAFTAGESDQIMVGRNGIFYDRQGRDWDATITKIVEHPISMRQAFWSPYKQLGRFVGEQIEKIAAAKAKAAQEGVNTNVVSGVQKATAKPDQPPPPFDAGKFAGIFAAIGLAIGAIGTAIASVVTGFLNLAWWQMPLALAGLMLAVSGPSVVIATMKLRQRNLAPILDATGWAVNARAKINIPFGGSLTALARLPDGAERSLKDPYAVKNSHWPLAVTILAGFAALAAAWRLGILTKWFGA
ncbi:MAG: hypothetical protein K2X44_01845 [Magnetospirillum sp.]|nr:hypothetical protein [Magnetospirillum sp.]